MTRNQMIGAGCGAAGCLGLIVVAFAGFGVYWYNRTPARYESNYNYNRSSNRNSNTNANTNSNTTNSAPSELSMTSDNQHRLHQAASATNDRDLIKRVNRKLGLVDAEGMPTKRFTEFLKEHLSWIFNNSEWIQTVNTPEKARAYVDEHIDD